MIVLSGAALVLPDRVLSPGTLVIDDGRIAEIRSGRAVGRRTRLAVRVSRPLHRSRLHRRARARRRRRRCARDRPDGDADRGDRGAAAALRRHRVLSDDGGVRAGGAARACSIRCGRARETPPARAARVLPAHLESNFINPEYAARSPRPACAARALRSSGRPGRAAGCATVARSDFTAADILAEIERAAPDVGIVTLASGARRRARSGALAGVARPSRVARPLRRDLRRGARGDRRRRAACDASVQPHAAAQSSRAGPGRRRAADRRSRRGDHLRRRARASGAGPHGDRRQAAVANLRDHRRHRRLRAAGRLAARCSAASRSPPARRRRCCPTARSPAAC